MTTRIISARDLVIEGKKRVSRGQELTVKGDSPHPGLAISQRNIIIEDNKSFLVVVRLKPSYAGSGLPYTALPSRHGVVHWDLVVKYHTPA